MERDAYELRSTLEITLTGVASLGEKGMEGIKSDKGSSLML